MRAIASSFHETGHGLQLAVATGFLALTLVGAVADRRNAFVDRSAVSSRTVEHSVAPPTSAEMVREMMTHD